MEKTFFEWMLYILEKYWPNFLKGAGTTLFIALLSTLLGACIGLLMGIIKTMPRPKKKFRIWLLRFVNILVAAYVEFFRGTPMMVQAIVFYFGIQEFFKINFDPLWAGIIIVSINTGAYMADVVRGGINSIDVGQGEGAKSIGMTYFQTLRYVVLPQTIKNILPSIGNELIINIKDTAVLNVISVTELFFATKSIKGAIFRTYETFIVSAIIYLVMTFTISRLLKGVEHRLHKTKDTAEVIE